MYHSRTHIVEANEPYVPTPGIIAADVVIVDRNGIGVKHGLYFESGSETVDVTKFEWYGVKRTGLEFGEYINVLSESITTSRTTEYGIGSTVVVGRTYAFYYGAKIAKYTAVAGDTDADVLSGLSDAIDAILWGSFTVTTSLLTSTTMQVVIDTTAVEFRIFIGQEKWKYGYKCVLDAVEYIILNDVETIGAPTLPSPDLSYAFSDILAVPSTVQAYLYEPLSAITYVESANGTTEIYGVSSAGNVPFGECVISQSEQKVYFYENLNTGEIIKIFSK